MNKKYFSILLNFFFISGAGLILAEEDPKASTEFNFQEQIEMKTAAGDRVNLSRQDIYAAYFVHRIYLKTQIKIEKVIVEGGEVTFSGVSYRLNDEDLKISTFASSGGFLGLSYPEVPSILCTMLGLTPFPDKTRVYKIYETFDRAVPLTEPIAEFDSKAIFKKRHEKRSQPGTMFSQGLASFTCGL